MNDQNLSIETLHWLKWMLFKYKLIPDTLMCLYNFIY